MKKILIVITTAFTRTGGLSSVMLNYWRTMDKTGLLIDFASNNIIEDQLYDEIIKEGSHYFQLPPRKQVFSYFRALCQLCRGYDVIHVHANSATSVIELTAAKIARVHRRIHHNHTSRTQYPCLNKFLRPLFLRLFTHSIACSEQAGEWLFGSNKYIILPNAIDLEKYEYAPNVRNLIRESFGIHDDEFVIGHIGRFMNAKNHEFLIKIFAKYHSTHPHSKLLLVGDGEWRPQVESWVQSSGCSDAIILAGLCSDIQVIIQAFDIFLFPSIYEGLPLTVLEAQASGLPSIISSNVTTLVDIGRDVIMKDLSDGFESWAELIDEFDCSCSAREIRCAQNYELITNAHFNIKYEADLLLKIYRD